MAPSNNRLLDFLSASKSTCTRILASDLFALCSVLCPILLALFYHFIFGKGLYMYGDIGADTAFSYWPNLVHINRRVHSGDFSFWSPQIGLGGDILSASYFLLDPFNWILFLLPAAMLARMLVWVAILKLIGCAVVGYFLAKRLECDRFPSIICALSLALNGYTLVNGQHYFFLTGYFFTLLLLLAFETCLQDSRMLPLTAVVAVFVISSFYFFYMAAIYLLVYFTVRILFSQLPLSRVAKQTPILLFGGLSGLGLSSFILIPILRIFSASPRIGMIDWMGRLEPMNAQLLWSCILRFFSPSSLGIGSKYSGALNYYEAPTLFVALPIAVFALIAIAQAVRLRPIVTLTVLSVLMSLLYFQFFSIAMNAFQYRMYRWTHVLAISFSLLAAACLRDLEAICLSKSEKRRYTTISLMIALGLASIAIFSKHLPVRILEFRELWASSAICVVIALVFWIRSDVFRYALILALFLVSVVPGLHKATNRKAFLLKDNPRFSLNSNDPAKYVKANYFGYYRIHSGEFASYTESLELDYLGLPLYSSLSEPGYVAFTNKFDLGFTRGWINLIPGPPESRPTLLWLLGVRYFYRTTGSPPPENFSLIQDRKNFRIYVNSWPTSLAYAYSEIRSEEEFMDLYKRHGDNAFLMAASVDDTEFLARRESATQKTAVPKEVTPAKREIPPPIEVLEYRDGHMILRYDNSSKSKVFGLVSIPYSKGWSATLNGKMRPICRADFGLVGFALEPGINDVVLTYRPVGLKTGIHLTLCTILVLVVIHFPRAQRTSRPDHPPPPVFR